jgi:hypothetical protein
MRAPSYNAFIGFLCYGFLFYPEVIGVKYMGRQPFLIARRHEIPTGPGSQRAADISCALLIGGPMMNARLTFALFLLLLLGVPVSAQISCSECLKAAQDKLKQCLSNAVSEDDKVACAESQQAQAKICENGE